MVAAVPVVAPLLALYGSGLVIEDPTLTGPFPLGPKAWAAAAHPSGGPPAPGPPRSENWPVAPAVVGSALMISWARKVSPALNLEVETQLASPFSIQVVERLGTRKRVWIPFASAMPFPSVRTILPLVSVPAPPAAVVQGFAAGSSPVP